MIRLKIYLQDIALWFERLGDHAHCKVCQHITHDFEKELCSDCFFAQFEEVPEKPKRKAGRPKKVSNV